MIADEDKRVVILTPHSPEPTNAGHHEEEGACFATDLLSATDLDFGGRYSSGDYSIRSSTDSDEAVLTQEREEIANDCEAADYLLELNQANKENNLPETTISDQEEVRVTKRAAASENLRRLRVHPTPRRKPLRRPKPETIARIAETDKANREKQESEYYKLSLPSSTLRVNSKTGKGYWVGAHDLTSPSDTPRGSPKSRLEGNKPNSTGNADADNWEDIYDNYYSHRIDQAEPNTANNIPIDQPENPDSQAAESSETTGRYDQFEDRYPLGALERHRPSNDRNCLRAGSNIVEPPINDYRPDRNENRHIGYPCDQQSVGPYHTRNPGDTDIDQSSHHRRASYPRSLASQVHPHRQSPVISRRRYTRRVQDDSWCPPRLRQPSPYNLGEYRRRHEHSSPNSVHLSVQYRSPKYRLESRLNSVNVEVEDIRQELRNLQSSERRQRQSYRESERQRRGFRW